MVVSHRNTYNIRVLISPSGTLSVRVIQRSLAGPSSLPG